MTHYGLSYFSFCQLTISSQKSYNQALLWRMPHNAICSTSSIAVFAPTGLVGVRHAQVIKALDKCFSYIYIVHVMTNNGLSSLESMHLISVSSVRQVSI